MDGSSGRRRWARTDRRWTSGSAPWPWPSRWARRSTISKKPSFATRPSSAAPRTRSTSPGWSPPMSCGATCRSAHWDSAGRRVPARRAPAGGTGRGERAGRGQHPAAAAPLPPGRTAPRPRDPRHLPFRPARLLRDAHPFAERIQSRKHLRRHAVPRDADRTVNWTSDTIVDMLSRGVEQLFGRAMGPCTLDY